MTPDPYRISFVDEEPLVSSGTPLTRNSVKKGCITVIVFVLLAVMIILLGYFLVYPALTPNKIHGDFLAAEVVPSKNGTTVWIQTDGSFNYIKTTQRPGYYSTGKKCFLCKTWTYIYDPFAKKILKTIKTPWDDIVPVPSMFYSSGKVWIVTNNFMGSETKVNVYDSETGDLLSDTKQFSERYAELNSGISNIRTEQEPPRLVIETHDGRTGLVFSIGEEKIYQSEQEFRKFLETSAQGDTTVYALSGENISEPRKFLYKVTGPKRKLSGNTSYQNYVSNPSSLKFMLNASAELLNPDEAYLEGLILHQDSDCIIIVHQTQVGKKAGRMLTCVDTSGSEKWTVPPPQLFEEMQLDEEKDAFSKLFFIKDKLSVRRQGDLIVLSVQGAGLMGFDSRTGRKLWLIDF